MALRLAGQLIELEPLAHDLGHRQTEPVGVLHTLAVVVSEGLFVKIPEQVERLDAHIGAVDSALEQAPEVFESVCVNLPIDVFDGVVNNLMGELTLQTIIGQKGIGVERGPGFHVLLDLRLERVLPAIRNHDGTHLPATFEDTHDGGLVLAACPGDPAEPLRDVHVPRLAADEGFVRFDVAGQFAGGRDGQGESNPVVHEPCGLLRHAEGAVDFVGTHAVLAVDDHPHRGEPLIQANRGILEDGPRLQGELPQRMLFAALPAIILRLKDDVLTSAARACDAIRPATGHEIVAAVIGIGEVENGSLKSGRFHELSIARIR
jgi:hypothetical protein